MNRLQINIDFSVFRYSFQGQEKDDEVAGASNSINYTYRMHNVRVGRFFAVDPLAASFSWNSPYAFSENRVLDAIELEGLEAVNVHDNIPQETSDQIIQIIHSSEVFQSIIYNRDDFNQRANTDFLIVLGVKDLGAYAFTVDISYYSNLIWVGANSIGSAKAINQKKAEESKDFLEEIIPGLDLTLFNTNNYSRTTVICIDEKYLQGDPVDVAKTFFHEYIGLYLAGIDHPSDSENDESQGWASGATEHLRLYGIDIENPYADLSFYTEEEINSILGKDDGISYSPQRYAPGSPIDQIWQEVNSYFTKPAKNSTESQGERNTNNSGGQSAEN